MPSNSFSAVVEIYDIQSIATSVNFYIKHKIL